MMESGQGAAYCPPQTIAWQSTNTAQRSQEPTNHVQKVGALPGGRRGLESDSSGRRYSWALRRCEKQGVGRREKLRLQLWDQSKRIPCAHRAQTARHAFRAIAQTALLRNQAERHQQKSQERLISLLAQSVFVAMQKKSMDESQQRSNRR